MRTPQVAQLPHVVVVGAGFGGLNVAKALRRVPVRVTVIDRNNFHLFQPLLYQVATAGLSPADIAMPIRSILHRNSNVECLLQEVVGIDRHKRLVLLKDRVISYDYLVLATGSVYNYFGHSAWETSAPGLKTITDATHIRRKLLLAFETAEQESSPEIRSALLRIVIVGGGPTGVELAGSIAELAHRAIAKDFQHIDPRSAEIILVEAGERILAAFPPNLSEAAARKLIQLGVTIKSRARVQDIDATGVTLENERINARTVIWAAGVVATPVGKWLGVETDKAGRVKVDERLNLPGDDRIFIIGDICNFVQDGRPLPGLAPVAMQMGKYVADVIKIRVKGAPAIPGFRYWDKGNLATVGRRFAVAEFGGFKIKGLFAWLTWLVIHIFYLIGFRNRVAVLLEWAWMYFTYQRGARLITPVDRRES